MEIQCYPNLTALLHEVHETVKLTKEENKAEVLMSVMVKHHYWPYIQMKYFSSQSSLVMLHNVYKQDIPIENKALYDECRSVIVDMAAPEGKNIVLSLSKKIPIRQSVDQFKLNPPSDVQLVEMGFEGTMLYMYHHDDRWYISTSTCPSVDRSRYFNPKKSHGTMFDEVLQKMFPDVVSSESRLETSKALRTKFFSHLDPTKAYSFVLVHHENGYLMNYASTLGEQYAVLYHLSTRERETMKEVNVELTELKEKGLCYTQKFATVDDAFTHLNETPTTYVVIVHTPNQLYKVSTVEMLQKEENNLGHPNPWVNLLWVYMQNKPHLRMEYYIENHPEIKDKLQVADSKGEYVAAPRLIAKVMTSMRDILYNLYRSTTYYYKTTKTYRMDRDYDQKLPPILRFHLAQLRHIQMNYHSDAPLTRQAVHHYLCHHQTLKNIRLLVDALTTNSVLPMDQTTADCFYNLNKALKNK